MTLQLCKQPVTKPGPAQPLLVFGNTFCNTLFGVTENELNKSTAVNILIWTLETFTFAIVSLAAKQRERLSGRTSPRAPRPVSDNFFQPSFAFSGSCGNAAAALGMAKDHIYRRGAMLPVTTETRRLWFMSNRRDNIPPCKPSGGLGAAGWDQPPSKA